MLKFLFVDLETEVIITDVNFHQQSIHFCFQSLKLKFYTFQSSYSCISYLLRVSLVFYLKLKQILCIHQATFSSFQFFISVFFFHFRFP